MKSGGKAGVKEDGASLKAAATDCTNRCIQSTLNLLQNLAHASPSHSLAKLPQEIVGKVPNVKKTGELLHQMPAIIISLDTYLDTTIQSASCLHDVKSLFLINDVAQSESLFDNDTNQQSTSS